MGLFLDSFDHYTDLAAKYDGVLYAEILDGKGRYGTAGLSVSGSSGGYVYKNLSDAAYWSMGVAWIRDNDVPSAYTMSQVLGIRDSNTWTQVNVWLNYDGNMVVTSGPSNTVIVNTTKVTRANKFYYIELKTYISPTSGWVELWMNESLRASAYNINTDYSSSGVANRSYLYGGGNSYFDDLAVKYGDTEQARFGDNRIICLYPSSDGVYSHWTPSSGSAHYSLINESIPSTTGYITSTGSPIDTYGIDTLESELGSLSAIQCTALCDLTLAGARTIDYLSYNGSSGSRSLGTSVISSMTYGYSTVSSVYQPNTQNPWTVTVVNNDEFGFTLL